MTSLRFRIPDLGSFALGGDHPSLTLGRASANDVVIPDGSLSRCHARLRLEGGLALLEDLGSRNGTFLNGQRLDGTHQVVPGDQVTLGRVSFILEAGSSPSHPVLLDDRAGPGPCPSLVVPISSAHPSPVSHPGTWADDADRLRAALGILHALSLELMRDVPLETLLSDVLDRLFAFLRPFRAAVLLREPDGTLLQVAIRSAQGDVQDPLRLSHTMVEAALDRREAMLVGDAPLDPHLAQAASFILSGVASVMTVPLEHQGEVAGLLYLDATRARPPFTAEDLQLVASVGHLAAAKVQQTRAAEEIRRKRLLEHELALARQIQLRLLPSQAPNVPGYALLGHNRACREVSGDLFGFWPRADGRLWVAIADVSGKGVGAGLLMATFQAFMSAWAEDAEHPADLATRLSVALAHRTTVNRYITAFLGLLAPRTGRIVCTSAGHNPTPLLRADGSQASVASHGFPLALFPGTPYRQAELTLGPGDLLFLYTDGITEAESPEGVELGLQGAEAALRACAGLPLDRLEQGLVGALEHHTACGPLADDQTFVLLRREA